MAIDDKSWRQPFSGVHGNAATGHDLRRELARHDLQLTESVEVPLARARGAPEHAFGSDGDGVCDQQEHGDAGGGLGEGVQAAQLLGASGGPRWKTTSIRTW